MQELTDAHGAGAEWVKRQLERDRRAGDRALRRALDRHFAIVTEQLQRRLRSFRVRHEIGQGRELPVSRELVARTVIITYTHVTVALQLMAAHECTIVAQDFGAEVRFDLHVPVSQATAFDSSIQDATHGSARVIVP